MKHSSGVIARTARNCRATAHYADALVLVACSDTAKANANANANASVSALCGTVLAAGVLLFVVPIVLFMSGCAVDVIAADLSIPGVFLTNRWRHI